MGNRPINLAILWHMHQPFYKDLLTGEYALPWVRLHASKDYYDMVEILKNFPDVKVNFNLVPSLLLQIDDYVNGKGIDRSLELTLKDPDTLTPDEQIYILQNFFMVNWDTMIKPYPRYLELLYKRGRYVSQHELRSVAERFSARHFMDLQVWANLTWFGPIYKHNDPIISGLIKKGKHFTAEDKAAVISKQKEIMAKIIPAYKDASERGQIEISTSPFYHPILPLLCDSMSAKEALPEITIPKIPFKYPEDAEAQIKMAIEYHTSHFGLPPHGMWPSEGSVSEQVVPIIAKTGIKWIATDVAILERSLDKSQKINGSLSPEKLYQPYLAELSDQKISMVFRDHFLSDQIGFVYSKWDAKVAVDDFMHHINSIRMSLPDDGQNYLVSVVLDGENAWEYYPESGKYFFEEFYGRLNNDPTVRTVKINDYLQENPPRQKLSSIFAGSWIDNNFKIWIGHEEDNTAWDYLRETRAILAGTDINSHPKAWHELYIAEGSDWWWWYGDDHSSENDAVFDSLFRKHLKNIYLILGKEPPRYLDLPIKQARLIKPSKEPAYLVNPVLDGKVTNYFEWLSAGHLDISKIRGAMHQVETILSDIYYGFSLTDIYLRLDTNLKPRDEEVRDISYSIITFSPMNCMATISFSASDNEYIYRLDRSNNKNNGVKEMNSFSVGDIIELSIPFDELGAKAGDKVEFAVVVQKEGQELERWPRDGAITIRMPTADYELENWSI